jgi:hypothetical protein
MMARIRSLAPAALLASLALVLAGFAPAASAKPEPPPPTPDYSPPTSEVSPFSGPDAFCTRDGDQSDTVPSTDPNVRLPPAEVVWLVAPTAMAAETSPAEAFARLLDSCGGIGARRVDLHLVRESVDPHADCIAAVTKFHPVIVVSADASPAWSCIVHDEGTILLTGSEVSNADLTGAGGRLVAVGSSEGIEEARLLNLVDSGRLTGRKVAIVTGPDAAGALFRRAAQSALATKRIETVDLARADAVLTPTFTLSTASRLVTATAAARHGQPLDFYEADSASASLPSAFARLDHVSAAKLLRAVNLYAFSSPSDPFYSAAQSPNTFSGMCNRAVAGVVTTRAGVTTTTRPPEPPLSPSYLATADACLLTRIVARGLFAAGPTLDQRAVITALHRLPYVDQVAPGGTPKPRPNQVVNEPVRRIEQVVVLTQLRSTCPATSDTTSTSTTAATVAGCWVPVSGWDDGGQVVNVPLAPTAFEVSH